MRTAADFGPSCLQDVPKPFGPYTPEFFAAASFSEDCLYLNVWAPPASSDKHPVLVWFHGGAFSIGSGAVPIYEGATHARRGAVVITVNYRLGVFDFLAPRPERESTERVSDNYDLLVSPVATGLFDRAIAQSGSGMGIPVLALRTAARGGIDLATRAGATDIAALRAVPGQQLLELTNEPIDPTAGIWMPPYVPTENGHVQPTNADDPRAAVVNDVPLLTGFTADEVMPSIKEITSATFETMVRKRYGTSAERILNLYPHADDDAAAHSQSVLARDRYMASLLMWASARRFAAAQPIFPYLFDHPYPIPESARYKAFHTSDVPYALGTLTTPARQFSEVDRRLSEVMQDAWLSFMTSGDPAPGSGLPWRPYRPGTDEITRLSGSPGPQPGVSSAVRLHALRDFVPDGGRLSLF